VCNDVFALKLVTLLVLISGAAGAAGAADPIEELRQRFVNPPGDAQIMMRWWWFGSAVTKPELERELRVMKSANIGGVEIQPVYPLELDDPQTGFRNLPYLSGEFLDDISFTARTAKAMGMRVDMTLGSGWPYGGPHTPVTEAAGRLRIEHTSPALENGEKLVAALPEKGLYFVSSRTGQQVKRPAVGAEGFVLDHYDATAVKHHLSAVADPLIRAFGANPPHAVFSDSLEVYGSDWTSDFLSEFQKRRGYDLLPHLPELAEGTGEEAAAIRHDWGKTLTELAEERYLAPIREWAHAHHTLFRSQTYGEPPVILSSSALVDLPEGEHGPEWRGFSAARWASSASHLYGRPITSTETWTWLHSPAFRATPLDMKAEADLHFIEGINQLIGHGWPYSPASAGEPGWRLYAAAVFNEHNPWFQVMPDIARYLQRISFLMRQGKPANDIAIYLPTDDAWAGFRPGRTSVDRSMDALLGPTLIPQVLNAGFNFDFIDDRAIDAGGVPYRILILPGVERIPLATLAKLEDFEKTGGIVIATRRLPSQAPGMMEASRDTPRIQAAAHELFETSRGKARFVKDEQTLGSTLAGMLTPDFAVAESAQAIGFVHRKLTGGEIYFVVNTSNAPVDTAASVRATGMAADWWDPFAGEARPADGRQDSKMTKLALQLAPYESRVLVFSKNAAARQVGEPITANSKAIDISSDWKVTFAGLKKTAVMDKLQSWTDANETKYYSGEVVYEKNVNLPSAKEVVLDFGRGQIVMPEKRAGPGMRALLESPVRESALVYVNGQKAGSVWHPPYELDVTRFVHTGENELRIVVANLAINEMAGRPLPNYKLLNLRYGERFQPQGFENLAALPSGILGPVTLKTK
jgi:hypothetical protein